MPAYEYFCDACARFEQRRDMAEAAVAPNCPTCTGGAAERDRTERARTEEPRVTTLPGGRRLPSTPHTR